jgi:hypothetical protein
MTEILSFLLVCFVVAALSTIVLLVSKPAWSSGRTTVIAASPVPLLLLAICLYVFVRAAAAPAEKCGLDACGMAMMFATFGAGVALAGFAAGLAACACVHQMWR